MIRIHVTDNAYKVEYPLRNGMRHVKMLQRNHFNDVGKEFTYLVQQIHKMLYLDRNAAHVPDELIKDEIEKALMPMFVDPRLTGASMDPLAQPFFTRSNPTAEELQYQRYIRGSRDPIKKEVMYHLDQFRNEISRCRRLIDELSDKLASKEDEVESLRSSLIEIGLDIS